MPPSSSTGTPGDGHTTDNGARADAFAAARARMVDEQLVPRGIQDARVLDAMRRVPRHLFVTPEDADLAYADGPLPIGHGQTISQPYIVALMIELAALPAAGGRVLEIGGGCGYQAAVLAQLAERVYTIEIIPTLAAQARTRLAQLGYGNVEVHAGDGYEGLPAAAPFHAIVVSAAPPRLPAPLLQQLVEAGRLVIPVGDFYQELFVYTREGEHGSQRSVIPVRFVPMVGQAQREDA